MLDKPPSLSEQWLLKEQPKQVAVEETHSKNLPSNVDNEGVGEKSIEISFTDSTIAVEDPVSSGEKPSPVDDSALSEIPETVNTRSSDETPLQTGKEEEKAEASAEGISENITVLPATNHEESVTGESDEFPLSEGESNEAPTQEDSEDQQSPNEEKPVIKLETAPADFRFPTTNQTRHCFTRYIEYHRCIATKGDEDASECDKYAKYYRALCPGEWIERWNEQRENGTFPGPL